MDLGSILGNMKQTYKSGPASRDIYPVPAPEIKPNYEAKKSQHEKFRYHVETRLNLFHSDPNSSVLDIPETDQLKQNLIHEIANDLGLKTRESLDQASVIVYKEGATLPAHVSTPASSHASTPAASYAPSASQSFAVSHTPSSDDSSSRMPARGQAPKKPRRPSSRAAAPPMMPLIAVGTVKRDLRSVEQIQADVKKRKHDQMQNSAGVAQHSTSPSVVSAAPKPVDRGQVTSGPRPTPSATMSSLASSAGSIASSALSAPRASAPSRPLPSKTSPPTFSSTSSPPLTSPSTSPSISPSTSPSRSPPTSPSIAAPISPSNSSSTSTSRPFSRSTPSTSTPATAPPPSFRPASSTSTTSTSSSSYTSTTAPTSSFRPASSSSTSYPASTSTNSSKPTTSSAPSRPASSTSSSLTVAASPRASTSSSSSSAWGSGVLTGWDMLPSFGDDENGQDADETGYAADSLDGQEQETEVFDSYGYGYGADEPHSKAARIH